MNVNPFSYLIEKLKGYVSKSGDTVFGDLTVNAENGTANVDAYTYLKVGNQTPKSSAKHSTGLLRLCGENGKYTDIYAPNSSASRDIVFPNASGTVALMSDMANMPITLHKQIVTNESVSFKIPENGLATIVVGHPYTGTWGEYAVIGGYTTGAASITTFHASTAVSSIVKTSNTIVTLTCSSGIFVYCTGVGVSLV